MGRRRAAQSVPAVPDDVEEVIIKRRKTKRGVRTMEKVAPAIIPKKNKPGQSSNTKKGKQHQLDPEQMDPPGSDFPTVEDTEAAQFIDEEVDDFPGLEDGQGQPHANVCTGSHLH